METSQTTRIHEATFFCAAVFFTPEWGVERNEGGTKAQANSHTPQSPVLQPVLHLANKDGSNPTWMDLILKVQSRDRYLLAATSQSLFLAPSLILIWANNTIQQSSDASSGAAISNRICTAAHAPRELRAASEQLSPRPPASYLQLWAISTLSDTSMFMSG